jgi:hypothetical protein
MLGDAKLAGRDGRDLLERGIYVIGFSFPVVPKGAGPDPRPALGRRRRPRDRRLHRGRRGSSPPGASRNEARRDHRRRSARALPDAQVELKDLTGTEDHWKPA